MRVVKAEDLTKKIERNFLIDFLTRAQLTEFIEDSSFEAERVIRCKECKRFMPKTRACTMGSLMCPDENDFCSRGER